MEALLGFAALMAVTCGVLFGVAQFFSEDAVAYRSAAREEAAKLEEETGDAARPVVWLGVCGGQADAWDISRTAARWICAYLTLVTYVAPGVLIYLFLRWKGPRPHEGKRRSPAMIYKGVCGRIADRYGWKRKKLRTYVALVSGLLVVIPGWLVYHLIHHFQMKSMTAGEGQGPGA